MTAGDNILIVSVPPERTTQSGMYATANTFKQQLTEFTVPGKRVVGGAEYETSMPISVFRQADYVHQALLRPLCYVIAIVFFGFPVSRARHGAEHDIFLLGCRAMLHAQSISVFVTSPDPAKLCLVQPFAEPRHSSHVPYTRCACIFCNTASRTLQCFLRVLCLGSTPPSQTSASMTTGWAKKNCAKFFLQ